MRQFMANGYTVHHDPATVSGEIVVVNTCGFIGDAQEESVNTILEMVEAKKSGRIGQLYVMGCLSERFLDDLKKEIPEVDAYYGKFNWKQLLSHLGKSYYAEAENRRKLTTPRHYAYLKISEGCDRSCSYCAIPIITGRHHSRPIEDLEEEVRVLVRRGTHEFQLIAQDLTFYGIDLYGGNRLAELTKRLSDIKGVEWLRLHYAYPAHFPLDLLRVMRERPNVCKYLDMALQHISDPMLKLMRRQITKAETYDLIETIRREVPGIHLRTTLMTGHPGETDADFAELLQFVRDIRFERLGAFTYSHESGTYCDKHYQDKIPESVKQERLGELMAVQERIATTYNEAKVGSRMRVVIDRAEDGFYIGRTEYDSPEVDPEVLIPFVDGQVLKPGQFHMAEITEAEPFDLYARIID